MLSVYELYFSKFDIPEIIWKSILHSTSAYSSFSNIIKIDSFFKTIELFFKTFSVS